MVTIPNEFTKNHATFRKVKREGSRAIYSRQGTGSKQVSYEVWKIFKHNGYTLGGITFPPGECIPSSSMWGLRGWTYNTLSDAEKRYKKI